MKKFFKRLKKKPILFSTIIFFSLFLLSTFCLTYSILKVNNIENLLRYLVSVFLILLVIYLLTIFIKIVFKGKNALIISFDIILVVLFIITSYSCVTINNIYKSISNISLLFFVITLTSYVTVSLCIFEILL